MDKRDENFDFPKTKDFCLFSKLKTRKNFVKKFYALLSHMKTKYTEVSLSFRIIHYAQYCLYT